LQLQVYTSIGYIITTFFKLGLLRGEIQSRLLELSPALGRRMVGAEVRRFRILAYERNVQTLYAADALETTKRRSIIIVL